MSIAPLSIYGAAGQAATNWPNGATWASTCTHSSQYLRLQRAPLADSAKPLAKSSGLSHHFVLRHVCDFSKLVHCMQQSDIPASVGLSGTVVKHLRNTGNEAEHFLHNQVTVLACGLSMFVYAVQFSDARSDFSESIIWSCEDNLSESC